MININSFPTTVGDEASGKGASDKLTGRRFSERMDSQGELRSTRGDETGE